MSQVTPYHDEGSNNVEQNNGERDKDCSERRDDGHCQVEPQAHVLFPEREDNPMRIVGQAALVGKRFTDATDILCVQIQPTYNVTSQYPLALDLRPLTPTI